MLTTPRNSIPYPEQGDSPNEATAMANLVGQIDRRMVPRFSTTADRTSRVPSPTEGMIGYHVANHRLEVYRGGAWVAAPFSRTAVKTADTARTLTITNTADPELQVPAVSGRTYLLEANIQTFGDQGVDFKAQFDGPAATGSLFWWTTPTGGVSAPNSQVAMGSLAIASMPTTSISAGTNGSSTSGMYILRAVLTTSAAGTFTFSWSQVTSSALPTTVRAGSYLQVTMVG